MAVVDPGCLESMVQRSAAQIWNRYDSRRRPSNARDILPERPPNRPGFSLSVDRRRAGLSKADRQRLIDHLPVTGQGPRGSDPRGAVVHNQKTMALLWNP